MFAVRRLLSVGRRTALPQLQENVKSVKSLVTPLLSIEPRVLITSRKASKFVELKEVNSKGESIVLAELSVLDSTEIETKLSTEQDDHGRDQLEVTYTCPRCNSLNQRTIKKWVYENGTITARCQGCDDNHVVCDHHGSYDTNGEYELDAISEMVLTHKKYPRKLPKEILDVIDRYYSKS
ncbi:uncharacterized protein LOC106658304 [Trichogramma pretiosum]|uniref:uncharacterized protein LOC106658304 n=1 Tax=Trichogramma pretiosum TaxID=7493 RepID=UPI0006C9B606|nr:uncharacterized protein LOC106658304 [Trichogramma pretiosum]